MSALTLKIKYGDDLRRITVERTPLFAELLALVVQLFPNLRGREISIKYLDSDNDMVTIASDLETKDAIDGAKQPNNVPLRLFISEKASPASVVKGKAPTAGPAPAPAAAPHPLASLQNILEGNVGDLASIFQSLGLGIPPASAAGAPSIDISALLPLFQQLLGSQASAAASGSSSSSSGSNNNNNNPNEPVHHNVVCDGCSTSPIVGVRFKCTVCPDYDLCASCEAKNVHEANHALIKLSVPRGHGFGHHGHHGHHGPGPHHFRRFGGGCPPGSPDAEQRQGRGCPYMRRRGMGNNLLARYVQDVTVDDGTSMAPGTKFVKIWKMRNEGATAWPEQVVLAFVGGDQLGAPEAVAVPSVKESEEVDIAVDMIAPATPGRYTGYWRLAGPDGQRFGQRIWVDIFVSQDSVAAPSAPSMDIDTPVVPAPAPVPVPEVVPVAPVAPVVPPVTVQPEVEPLTSDEQQALAVLKEMGFGGDVLEVLRRNKGQLLSTIRDLCADN